MAVFDANILILCKTYPSPSGKYTETTCVAGIDENGKLMRLFPVPFRLVSEERQFKKWQWIKTKVEKANRDHRPESHSIKMDTIETGNPVSTKSEWAERRHLISPLETYYSFDEIEADRDATNQSLALLKPARILNLEIEPVANPEWTKEELKKLEQAQNQGDLFDKNDTDDIRVLRKLPFDFYYEYECGLGPDKEIHRHKIVDWEVGALYWKYRKEYGENWERHVRAQLEKNIPSKDLMFLMGNQQRFQHQWLIISLIYPPHQIQAPLF